ncbi:MAG: SRPBCC family protein [Nitrospinae bacterium]|nr:SRPBCC family protein [Nitrospinota bacterium]
MSQKSKPGMHTENRITIHGDLRKIFQLAAQVEKWPQILPHYRGIKVLQRRKRRTVVEMAAQRTRFPVRWTAVQEVFPYERITYKHIKGITAGMDVTWTFTPTEGGVEILITHDFASSLPAIGNFFSKYIVGGLFVKPIAGKTLRYMKQVMESGQVPGGRS